jgi:hypothetical protein
MGAQVNESGRACHAATLPYCRSGVNGRTAQPACRNYGTVPCYFQDFFEAVSPSGRPSRKDTAKKHKK